MSFSRANSNMVLSSTITRLCSISSQIIFTFFDIYTLIISAILLIKKIFIENKIVVLFPNFYKMKNYDLSASCNTIEKNSSFTGNFTSESDFRIDGSFEGNIETKGKVVIGKNGKIDGTIVCSSADIEGNFSGTIHVQDLLSIRSTGEVHGDVVMSKLIVESGAVFNAKSSMQNDATNIAPLKKITNFNDAREKTA